MISSSQEKGIDLNAKENLGLTALHVAGMNGNTEIVQVKSVLGELERIWH